VSGKREGGFWVLTLRDELRREPSEIRARTVVNAAGPWVGEVLTSTLREPAHASVRLVKGSHIVVSRLYAHDRCYIFQNADRRVFFAIPYERDFTLIGTTDLDYVGDPGDYVLKLDAPACEPALLSVYGGKITTYRRLAESALALLAPHLPAPRRAGGWTAREPLPGGDFPVQGFDALVDATRSKYPFLAAALARRLVRAYGALVLEVLGAAKSQADLGRTFGADLTEAEVRYLARREWAMTAEDVVWRRTKLGLRLSKAEIADVDDYLKVLLAAPQAAE
jgi:glycerol-3-phosphate dehydrogenase